VEHGEQNVKFLLENEIKFTSRDKYAQLKFRYHQ